MDPTALSDTVRRAARPAAIAVFAAVVAAALVIVGWHQTSQATASERMNRFGETLSWQIADLVVEPLLSNDRIRLGVLTTRMAEFDEVDGVAVYTVDNQLISIGGSTTNLQLPTFTQRVTVQDTVAGFVRLTLEPNAFETSFGAKLWATAPWWLGAMILAVLSGYISTLDKVPVRVPADNNSGDESTDDTSGSPKHDEQPKPASVFILIVNVFNQISLPNEQKVDVLRQTLRIASRVANLYAARAMPLTGTGVALAFDQTETADRPFEVVCAALLLREALGALNRDHYIHDQPEIRFRFGLHEGPIDDTNTLLESDNAADTVLLSALAPDGRLAVSHAVMASIERPERIEGEPVANPAADALTTTSRQFHVVEGVAATYQTLIERQAELIVAQR